MRPLLSAIALCVCAHSVFSQIPNDECASAIDISSLPFSILQNTRLATPNNTDPPLTCQDSAGAGKTVWFTYSADQPRYVTFSTLGSTPQDTFDTIIGIYSGTCGNLISVACNDDVDSSVHVRQSRISVYLKSGQTYYILVGEWGGGGFNGGTPTGGTLEFNAYEDETPPVVHGPKRGFVPGGVILNTDNFLTIAGMPPSGVKLPKPNINKRIEKLPPPANMRMPSAPYGSNYFEDVIEQRRSSDISRPVSMLNFEGIPQTNYIPPDPILAVGPNHIMVVVNSTFRIFDKNGTILKTIDSDEWFHAVVNGASTFDPIVMYDQHDHRWIFEMLHVDDANQKSYILLAVSDDDNPLGLWFSYALPSNALGDSTVGNWTDYARVGYDADAIYITGNQFGFTTNFAYSKVRIIPKAQLYANNARPITYADFWDFRDPENPSAVIFGLRPSITFGRPGKQFLLNDSPYAIGTFVTLWTLTNPVSSPAIAGDNIPVVQYYPSPDADQREGSGTLIEAFGSDIRNEPVYRDSAVWMVHAVASGVPVKYSSVRYIKIDPFQKVPLEDVMFGLEGYWHSYPALMINKNDEIVITFSRSGVDEYIGAFMTGRKKSDPPGLAPSILIREGLGNYNVVGGGRNRWGDYSGIGLDPVDETAMWTHTEFAAGKNKWGTWVSKNVLGPVPGSKLTLNRTVIDFGTKNVGSNSDTVSVQLVNDGVDSLVLSQLFTSNPSFIIANMPALPLKIPSLGSFVLKIFFGPLGSGFVADSVTACIGSSCISATSLVKLSGRGFQIVPSDIGVLYAASGSNDGGKLYVLNSSTGAASLGMLSGLSQISSLRIHPATKELIALDAAGGKNGGGALYRISSAGYSADKICDIALVNVKGFAFINDSLAYIGVFNGDIYTVQSKTGTVSHVASTGIRIGGLALNPVNGTLWLSVRTSLDNADNVYMLDTSTLTPHLVGKTGFGVATTDILFDKNGKLYGLTGLATAQNKLIVIDTTTGAGSLLGETGISGLQAIALNPDAVAEVGAASGIPPTRISLSQNYPNPFNPLTQISFELPSSRFVVLKVFDALGRHVQTLAEGIRTQGRHKEYFDASGMASGVYYYRLSAGSFVGTKKMILMK